MRDFEAGKNDLMTCRRGRIARRGRNPKGLFMPNAKRPAGPGRPTVEERDAAAEREELEELDTEDIPASDAGDPTRGPRTAERDAHTSTDKTRGGGRGDKS